MKNEFKFKKIMIIDDSEIDILISSRIIRAAKLTENVIPHASALDALEHLKNMEDAPSGIPEIILLDINMPGMNGFGFLEEFEKLPASIQKNCAIWMLSSSLNCLDHERAMSFKCVKAFLNKPIDKQKLTELAAYQISHAA